MQVKWRKLKNFLFRLNRLDFVIDHQTRMSKWPSVHYNRSSVHLYIYNCMRKVTLPCMVGLKRKNKIFISHLKIWKYWCGWAALVLVVQTLFFQSNQKYLHSAFQKLIKTKWSIGQLSSTDECTSCCLLTNAMYTLCRRVKPLGHIFVLALYVAVTTGTAFWQIQSISCTWVTMTASGPHRISMV